MTQLTDSIDEVLNQMIGNDGEELLQEKAKSEAREHKELTLQDECQNTNSELGEVCDAIKQEKIPRLT